MFEDEGLYTMGTVARLLDEHPETLRVWGKNELRHCGTQRRYFNAPTAAGRSISSAKAGFPILPELRPVILRRMPIAPDFAKLCDSGEVEKFISNRMSDTVKRMEGML